jgi:hypothetical protein
LFVGLFACFVVVVFYSKNNTRFYGAKDTCMLREETFMHSTGLPLDEN